jgi:hypothetical protein
MANDYSGRIWKIATGGTTPFGAANVKIKGGSWTGMTAAGQTFIITDEAGRAYTFTSSGIDTQVTFYELGWLSGPLTFSGTFTGEIDLFLATK